MSVGEIVKVAVNTPCSEKYCTFYKGNDAKLVFDFKLKKKALRVRAKVMATIGTIDHDFQLPNSDACTLLGCPLAPNFKYTYQNSISIILIEGIVTEYNSRFKPPKKEDYVPHVTLPHLSSRPPSRTKSYQDKSVNSEYRLCFPNHFPKRPYVYHAQPSRVFEAETNDCLTSTEYRERFPNYRKFIPYSELLPPHLSQSINIPSATKQKKDTMSRSRYFHELITDAKANSLSSLTDTSEQRTAYQWRPPPPKQQQHEPKSYDVSTSSALNYYEKLPSIRAKANASK
ncbi:unnamed protein product [Didymodactylos carnosus]|uniref:MD-2-related lipid-recognition domain-containing protein n=1 Tax=Didymodactylos carnosus TaxID=1234261 RepID=A0A813UZM3_9BILA|nr:unnamed protein product [Didymodactylos carnosus]CAF3622176.1 unnamed protein product [Didymodactylos carnosus]